MTVTLRVTGAPYLTQVLADISQKGAQGILGMPPSSPGVARMTFTWATRIRSSSQEHLISQRTPIPRGVVHAPSNLLHVHAYILSILENRPASRLTARGIR